MQVFSAFLISLIAGLSTVIGSFIIFLNIKEKHINKFITFCLAFSISIMIGISITDLIPSSFFYIAFNNTIVRSIIITITAFLFGVLTVFILNKLMKQEKNNNLYNLGILSMITLMVHNFPEGIATFIGGIQDINLGIKLGCAIMLHNIPEGISIAVPIYYSTKSKKKAIFHTFLSGISEPLGALLAYLFLSNFITETMISIVLLFVSGLMISLSINKLLPEALYYKETKYVYRGLIIGILLILINHFLF